MIKLIQKNLFSKIKDNDNRSKATKISSFIGYVATIIFLTVIFSEKLGGLTVALGVAGAGIAFALQEVIASFAGWLAIMFGNSTIRKIAFNWAALKVTLWTSEF